MSFIYKLQVVKYLFGRVVAAASVQTFAFYTFFYKKGKSFLFQF